MRLENSGRNKILRRLRRNRGGGKRARRGKIVPAEVYCPKCKSRNLCLSVEKEKVVFYAKSISFRRGFGILIVLFGFFRKNTVDKTYWSCQDCGDKFREEKDLIKERLRQFIACFYVGIPVFLITASSLLLARYTDFKSAAFYAVLVITGVFAVFSAALIGFGIKYAADYKKLRTCSHRWKY